MNQSIVCVVFVVTAVLCFGYDERRCPTECTCDRLVNETDCTDRNEVNTNLRISPLTQILRLSHNSISVLHGNEFQDAELRRLKELWLDHNVIEVVDKLTFNGLDKLEYLDLSFNKISYFSPDTFNKNVNLKVLNLSGNEMDVIQDKALLSRVPSLQVLSIARCGLTALFKSLFVGLPNLQSLNVSNNKLTVVNPETFMPLTKLKQLDLTKNEIKCNTQESGMSSWLTQRRIKFQPFCEEKGVNKSEKMVLMATEVATFQPTNATQRITKTVEDVASSVKLIPLVYAALIGCQIGILVGAFFTYSCINKVKQDRPTPPPRTISLNTNPVRTSFGEQASWLFEREVDEQFSLISVGTPPGTPPSPYRSAPTFPDS